MDVYLSYLSYLSIVAIVPLNWIKITVSNIKIVLLLVLMKNNEVLDNAWLIFSGFVVAYDVELVFIYFLNDLYDHLFVLCTNKSTWIDD